MCKICKSKETEISCVIKCANTKCKFYAHIPCAVNRNMIISLDFMTDYYGFSKLDRLSQVIPFYCNLHNRKLIESYNYYVNELDQVMGEAFFNNKHHISSMQSKNECEDSICSSTIKSEYANNAGNSIFYKDIKTEEDSKEYDREISVFNNFYNKEVNFSTQIEKNVKDDQRENSIDENFQTIIAQLNFEKNILQTGGDTLSQLPSNIGSNDNIDLKESNFNFFNNFNKILPQKPKYQHDDSISFNFNLPNLIPNSEYNFINIENNNNFNFNLDKEFESFYVERNKVEICPSALSSSNFDKFSKMFYEYFEKDINQMNQEDKSKITITQIKQLKNFLIKIIKNYKHSDKDISNIYEILKNEGLFED